MRQRALRGRVRDWTSNPRYGSASAMGRGMGWGWGRVGSGGGWRKGKEWTKGGKGEQFEDLVGRKTRGRNYGPLGGLTWLGNGGGA